MRLHYNIYTILCSLIASSMPSSSVTAQVNSNYVLSETQISPSSQRIKSYVFFDGLGRESVKATNGIGNNGEFTYSLSEITGEQTVTRNWLPVVGNQTIAALNTSDISQMATTQYGGDGTNAFENSEYDALNRPVRQYKAGQQWKSKPVTLSYVTNGANDVIKYSVSSPEKPSLIDSGYYDAGALSGVCTSNEDGIKVTVYTDAFGRQVLERRGDSNDTYFVYDVFGRLTFVLMPEYQSFDNLDQYGYCYNYDLNGNVIKKKLPGCDAVEYLYDNDNHCVSVQDGELRKHGLYRFLLYDPVGRLAIQGLSSTQPDKNCSSTVIYSCGSCGIGSTDYKLPDGIHLNSSQDGAASPAFMSSLADVSGSVDSNGSTVLPPPPVPVLYSNSLNLTIKAIEVVNYYDDYSFLGGSCKDAFPSMTPPSSPTATGRITGTVVLVSSGERIASVSTYDQLGNLLGTCTRGLGGNIENTENTYTYTNKILTSKATIKHVNGDGVDYNMTNSYNPINDRLSSVTHEAYACNMWADACKISYSYDNLGRTVKVSRPVDDGKGDVSYSYDIHGWITDITSGSFKERIHYIDGQGSPLYSGNISSMTWENGSQGDKGYKFTYDDLGRLVNSEYGENGFSSASGNYNERVGYDGNGNITSLVRHGMVQDGSFGVIDSLSMDYDGNQLAYVEENAAPVLYTSSTDMKNGSGDIQYNSNGALVKDGTRGITNIKYDYGGNPVRIQFDNGNVTKYVYSATGEKLRTVHYTAPANIHVSMGEDYDIEHSYLAADSTDYLLGGSVVFTNNRFSKILFDGGYISNDDYAYTYNAKANNMLWLEEGDTLDMAKENPFGVVDDDELAFRFYNKDHLGNNREVIDQTGMVCQVVDYYPYGTPFSGPAYTINSSYQPFKYNGKEFDNMHGLNTYDYGARQYYSVLPVWDRPDPLAEKYYGVSPYMYCLGNPVKFVDPDGRFPSMWKAQVNRVFSNMEATFTGCTVGDIVYDQNARTENGRYYYNKVSSDGEGGFVVTKVTQMSRELADDVSIIGTGIEGVGYAMTLTGVGAEAGVPTAKVGAAVSNVGTITGIAIDFFNEDIGSAIKSTMFYGANRKLNTLIKKIPGCEDLTRNILQQGIDLKMSLMEYTFDKAIEKKQEEQRSNKEDDDE